MADYSVWRTIVLSTFGKKSRLKTDAIIRDIMAVDLNLKPALLFDHLAVSPETMLNFLKKLQDGGLLEMTDPTVLVVEDTLFVTSLARMKIALKCDQVSKSHPVNKLDTLSKLDYSKSDNVPMSNSAPIVIDVSHTLDNPSILHNGSEIINKIKCAILDAIRSVQDSPRGVKVVNITLDEHINRTTLYGVLLGYPVVYWYKDSDRYNCRTCLDSTPLTVYRISAKFLSVPTEYHVVYSFSVPESCVVESVRCSLDKWTESLKLIADETEQVTDLKSVKNVVTLDTVAL